MHFGCQRGSGDRTLPGTTWVVASRHESGVAPQFRSAAFFPTEAGPSTRLADCQNAYVTQLALSGQSTRLRSGEQQHTDSQG